MAQPTIVLDESRWPLVMVTWPGATVSDEEFERAVLVLSGYSLRKQRFALVHDARHAERPSPKQRRFAADQGKKDADRTRVWLRGSALVVANPIIAGAVTALGWVYTPPYPQKSFSSLEKAVAWAKSQLDA